MGKVTGWYHGWHFALLAARTWLLILTFGFIGADLTCRSCRWQVQLQPQQPAQGLLMNFRTALGDDEAGEIPVDKRGEKPTDRGQEAADAGGPVSAASAGEKRVGMGSKGWMGPSKVTGELPEFSLIRPRLSPPGANRPTRKKLASAPARFPAGNGGRRGSFSEAGRVARSALLGRRRNNQSDRRRRTSRKPRGAPAERDAQLESRARAAPEHLLAKATRFRQEELKLTSTTFALTGDSAHNQAMVHWSGHNSSPLNDLAYISKILNFCVEKIQLDNVFIETTCEILKLYGLPFYKKKLSDEVNYAKEVKESIAQLGYLIRVPCSQIRIQICKCIISFYHADPSVKEFEGYQPTTANYKKQIVELGGLAETLVLSLTLVENQLSEKLWIIKTLQHLSVSEANCKLMMKAQAPRILCSHLNDVDPSGQLLFRSSEILWNLLEKTSKEEIIDQLSNLECVHALKEAFTNLLIHGSRHYDRQLRNDILVIATLVAQNPGAPMIETGFVKQLILFATFAEVKSHNPLIKGLRLTSCYEDFELKKLLLNMLTVLAKDLCSVQLLHEGKVMLALFHYLKPNEKGGALDMSAAQYEELQLLAIATLATVAPLLIEDYVLCQGNTRLLLFLEWCVSNDPFFSQGNSFHGTGGRGTKLAQMRFCLRVLNPIVSLCDDDLNMDLCDQGAIHQLLGILNITTNNYKDSALVTEIQSDILLILSTLCENNLHRKELFGWEGVDTLIPFMKMDAKKFYSGLGHNRLLFCALDCLWCCVMGCTILEDYFLEKEGLFTLLDLLLLNQKNVCNQILGILVEFCDNPKTVSHINVWRGKKDQTAANLLINLWRQEEEEMGVKHDKAGRIVDTKKPLVGQFQKTQEVIPMPASCPTIAVMDVAENMRAKIYCLICKLGFENLPGLSAKDFVTLAIIRRYLDFKVGEIWDEVCTELKQEKFRPVTPDQEALQLITETLENVGKVVVSIQTEMLESQQFQELQEEEKCYGKIHSLHKQKEMVTKSWENFLARTSNYEALKKAKRLREKSIESSRSKVKQYNATFHPTDIKGLNTTVASGRLVAVESTPSELIGGPLADTDLALKKLPIRGGALKKFREVKVIDSFKKGSVSVK